MRGRWIDLGRVAPLELHAGYTGIAYAMQATSQPVVVWGRTTDHLCLGQSQGWCEVAPDVAVPVVRRLLGGGAVWIDAHQYCYALVAPRQFAPVVPAQWFGWGLEAARLTLQGFGLPARRVGADLWVRGRKIAGSGAATLGGAAVLASSFLMRFPHERFARAVSAPSPGYRRWLEAALHDAMTDWETEQTPPREDRLATSFRQTLSRTLGWRLEDDTLTASERTAIQEAREEISEPIEPGRRLTAGGIRLNHRTFLTETNRLGGRVRRLTIAGRAVRREVLSSLEA